MRDHPPPYVGGYKTGYPPWSQFDVFGADFEAFVLVFPDDGGVVIEEEGEDFGAGVGEKFLGFFGGVLEGFVVIAGFLSLRVIPMRNGVDGTVFVGPGPDRQPQFIGQFVEGNAGVAAMLADEAGLQNVAGEERKQGRAAAGGLDVSGRGRGEAFEPDLAVVGELGREPVSAQQWMRQAPDAAFELTEGLGHPPREGEFVPIAVNRAVFLPQSVQRRLG